MPFLSFLLTCAMSAVPRFTFLHGRLTVRKCAQIDNYTPDETHRRSASAHLQRLAQSKCIKNLEGAVEIGSTGEERYVKVGRRQFLLEEATEVHRTSARLEVFLWWCTSDQVITLWLDE